MNNISITKKSTILVVDDTPDNLTLMSNLLKDDYKVKIVNSGEKALKIALSSSPPDLILLDIMMPEMDGYEVCRQLKCDPKTKNIAVIFLSAKGGIDDEKKGLELGAVDYIIKPISPPIVLARVKNHIALKSMSDFLLEKNIELESARLVAERATLAKSEFISNMSHELRSPLNAILGFAQLMETASPPPNSSQKESITQILHAGWHLLSLINEILDFAVIESGKVSMSPEPVSLSEVLSECETMMTPQGHKRGIKLNFPEFYIPFYVKADRTRLKQVLINLLSNAIKYNRNNGSVEVKCTASTPEHILISIKDSGEGLSPENVKQLFQPFNRLGQEKSGEEGTGIGLVMTKQLVELMGGVIGVQSAVGIGSVFWFELESTDAPQIEGYKSDHHSAVPIHMKDGAQLRTILYVEDNPANMKLVEQLIARRNNIHLLRADNGTNGIELARDHQPDVILMDINLPGISGIQALKILRDDPLTGHIPVVAISANAMARDIKNGLEAGFFRYLTKPIDVIEFTNTLNEAMIFAENGINQKKCIESLKV